VLVELTAAWRPVLGTRPNSPASPVDQLAAAVGQPPAEHRRDQLGLAVHRLLGAVNAAAGPLVLVVDDLHTADPESLQLLGDELADEGSWLVVGAYRAKGLPADHPLRTFLRRARDLDRLTTVELRPLADTAMTELVGAAVTGPPAEVATLASLVARTTNANPLAAELLLHRLAEQRLLRFDPHLPGWSWRLDDLVAADLDGEATRIAVARLSALGTRTRQLLRAAAALGESFDLDCLALVTGTPAQTLADDLRPALRHQLVHLVGGRQARYRWAHGTLREVVSAAMPRGERPGRRAATGRALAAGLDPARRAELAFQLVADLRAENGRPATTADRLLRAELHLAAGRRAARLGAANAAYEQLRAGVDALPGSAWTRDYRLAHTLHVEAARAARQVGQCDAGDRLLADAMRFARDAVDRAVTVHTRLELSWSATGYGGDLAPGVEALRLLGVGVPADGPTLRSAAETALSDALGQVSACGAVDTLAARTMTDPRALLAVAVIAQLLPAAADRPHLAALLAATGVELTLHHGACEHSAVAFAWLGGSFAERPGGEPAARWCADVALALTARAPDTPAAAAAKATVALAMPFLAGSVPDTLVLLHDAHVSALEHGNVACAMAALTLRHVHKLAVGTPLGQVADDLARASRLLRPRPQYRLALLVNGVLEEAVGRLTARAPAHSAPADRLRDRSLRGELGQVSSLHLTSALMTAYLLGDHAAAVRYADAAEAVPHAHGGGLLDDERRFYQALAVAAQPPAAGAAQRRARAAKLTALHDQLERWAAHRPAGFAHRALLVSAELARLDGRVDEAMSRYQRVIGGARENGFLHVEAIAAELGGRCALEHGEPADAVAYLRRARLCYTRWGAHAKVQELDRLVERSLAGHHPARSIDQLDLHTMVKAFQTISSVLDLDKLTTTLLELLTQQAGAQRGLLFLHTDGELRLAAQATAESNLVTVTQPGPGMHGDQLLPRAIVEHTRRTREVVVGGVDSLDRFRPDPYLHAHRPRAMLAAPIAHHDRLLGVLYLEHRLRADAFSPAQLDRLEALCAQAAICLDNALMYASLAEVNRILDATFDRLPVGLILLRPDLTVHRASPHAVDLTGLPIRPGTPLVDLLDVLTPTDVDGNPLRLEPSLASVGPEQTTSTYRRIEIIRPDGKRLYLDTWVIPLRNTDGLLLGVTLLVNDATAEEKRSPA
jgi:PAS domain-containing protein